MRLYRSTIRLRSASASPWQADMLFGHLCWSLVRREGEEFLTDLFLADYRAGRPPLLLSDGFPAGWLPRPRASARPAEHGGLPRTKRIEEYRHIKDQIKAAWLSVNEFNRVRSGEVVLPAAGPQVPERLVSKNQIDRLTNTVGGPGGQLYEFTEFCLQSVDVYWRVSDGYLPLLEEFLDDLRRTGYGKRRCVGYGEIAETDLKLFGGFDAVPEMNGFMTLCNFVPAASDPTRGFWSTTVKYGKLGEESAASAQPFKRPLIQLTAGSCFYDEQDRDWYGRLVEGVAADPRVVQYGYAFPIRLCLPVLNEET